MTNDNLDSLEVKNFQSIASAKVDLGKFTVFTGPSSSGKSAMLRASRALLRNSFVPSQVRQGSKNAEVSATFGDNTIKAVRGKENTYWMNDEKYPKPGRNVPETIEKFLQLPLIEEVDSNFATQFDRPYLLADPGSTGAKVLGSLTNVSVLHSGMRESRRRAMDLNNQAKVKNKDLDEVNLELTTFDRLPEQLDYLAKIQNLQEDISSDLEDLKVLISNLDKVENLENSLAKIMESQVDLASPLKQFGEVDENSNSLDLISRILERITQANDSTPTWDYKSVPDSSEELDAEADKLSNLNKLISILLKAKESFPIWDYNSVPDSSEELDSLSNELFSLVSLTTKIKDVGEDFKRSQIQIAEMDNKITTLHEEYGTILSGHNTCPMCGQDL